MELAKNSKKFIKTHLYVVYMISEAFLGSYEGFLRPKYGFGGSVLTTAYGCMKLASKCPTNLLKLIGFK